MISQTKTLKIKSFISFNFAIAIEILKFVLRYIYQRMEQEWEVYGFDYPLVNLMISFFPKDKIEK